MLQGSAAWPSGDFRLKVFFLIIVSTQLIVTSSDMLNIFIFTESQWKCGTARIKRVQTGWRNTKWGPRPWRRLSHFMQNCWTHTAAWKKCIMKNYSSIGEYWASEAVPILQPLQLISQQPRTPATVAQTIIFSYMKGGWPTKDERVHERVTGYEGTS